MLKLALLMFSSALALPVLAWKQAEASPPTGICDELIDASPGLHGICVALCEESDCTPDASPDDPFNQCLLPEIHLLTAYERMRSDGDPDLPCVDYSCPCWTWRELQSMIPNRRTDSWRADCAISFDATVFERDAISVTCQTRKCRRGGFRHTEVHVVQLVRALPPAGEGQFCSFCQEGVPGLPEFERLEILTFGEYEACRDQLHTRLIELGIADMCETN